MTKLKTLVAGGALACAMTAGFWAATTTTASAEVVCNRWNECWHTRDHITYPGRLGVVYHDDGWRGRHYHWRHDRFDHGYYRNGIWITF